SVAALGIDPVGERPPSLEIADRRLYHRDRGGRMGLGGDMRGHDDAWVMPERVVRRQRFLVEHIERRAGKLAGFERIQQIGLDELASAPDIDDRRAARRPGKGLGVEDAFGLAGQWKERDDDLACPEDRGEAGVAVMRLEPGHGPRRAAPAGNVETDRLELAARILAHRAEAEDADAALAGVLLRPLAPFAGPLLGQVVEVLAVQPQYLEDDVLAHRVGHIRVDQAHDRHLPRKAWIGEDAVDAGAEADDQLEVREAGQEAALGLPYQRVVDRRQVAELGREAELAAGHRRQQKRAPARLGGW